MRHVLLISVIALLFQSGPTIPRFPYSITTWNVLAFDSTPKLLFKFHHA